MWILFAVFNYFIQKQINGWGGGKIKPNGINDLDNDEKNKKINLEDKFYILTQNIRNSQTLTNDNIDFIEKLDKDKLIELIKLYNLIIVNLTDFIKEYLH